LPGGEQFHLGARGHQALTRVEHRPNTIGVRGHRRDPDEGAAVQVEMTSFGHRDLVPAPNLGEQWPENRPFLLERTDVPEHDVQFQRSDEHGYPWVGPPGPGAMSRTRRSVDQFLGFSRIS